MSRIYIALYQTESGDNGLVGPWKKEPTNKEIEEFFLKNNPDEFFDEGTHKYRLISWTVYYFNPEDQPNEIYKTIKPKGTFEYKSI